MDVRSTGHFGAKTRVNADPYLNTDAGTMSPFEHGEVFVLDDGGEVSLTTACPWGILHCLSCSSAATIDQCCGQADNAVN